MRLPKCAPNGEWLKFLRREEDFIDYGLTDMIAQMKTQDEYKNWTEGEILVYLEAKFRTNAMRATTSLRKSQTNPLEKPTDPFWSQYTYEEILGMLSEGANVPEEFVEWAMAMANSDNVSYEIPEDSINDVGDVNALDDNTGAKTEFERTRKMQQMLYVAEAKEDQLEEEEKELSTTNITIAQKNEELKNKRQNSNQKIAEYTEEFKTLDDKIKRGEELSDNELARYKTLGEKLNSESRGIVLNTKNVEQELSDLYESINNVSGDLEVLDTLQTNIERFDRAYSSSIKDYNGKYAPINKNGFGTSSQLYYAAISGSMFTLASNMSITMNNIRASIGTNIDTNVSSYNTSNVETPITPQLQTTNPELNNKKSITDKNSEDNTIPEENQDNPAVGTTSEKNESVENETVTTTQESGEISEDKPIETTETEPEETELNVGETSEPEDSGLLTQTQEYLDNSNLKIEQNGIFRAEFDTITAEVITIQENSDAIEEKFNKDFEQKTKEIEQIIDRIRNTDGLPSDKDLRKYASISAELNDMSGNYIRQIQQYTDILNDFQSRYYDGKNVSNDNIKYGEESIEAGKQYAISEFGVRYIDPELNLTKEEEYDILYGKSGESLGRDTIDAGESLVSGSQNIQQSLSSVEDMVNYAQEKSASYATSVLEVNNRVNSIAQDFQNTIESKSGDVTEITDAINNYVSSRDSVRNSAQNSAGTNNSVEVGEDDSSQVEAQGNDANSTSSKALTRSKQAETDDKSNNLTSNKHTSKLKKSENKLQKLTKENSKLQLKARTLENKAETVKNENSNAENTSDEAAAKELEAIDKTSVQLTKQLDKNDKEATKEESSSDKESNDLIKDVNAETKTEESEQDETSQNVDTHQDLSDKIVDIGDKFTDVKNYGGTLMLSPWTNATGVTLFNIGKNGEQISFVANEAVQLAKGNLSGVVKDIGNVIIGLDEMKAKSSKSSKSVDKASLTEEKSSDKTDTELNKVSEKTTIETANSQNQDEEQLSADNTREEEEVISTDEPVVIDNNAQVKAAMSKSESEEDNIPDEEPLVTEDITKNIEKEVSAAVVQSIGTGNSQKIIQEGVAEVMQSVLSEENLNAQSDDVKKSSKRKLFTRFEQQKQDAIKKTVQKITQARDAR